MGRIEVSVDEAAGITINRAYGEVDFSEIDDRIMQFYKEKFTKHVIWDFSGISKMNATSEEIMSLAKKTSVYGESRKGGCNAIVVQANLIYGLSRMYELYSDSTNSPQKNGVFHTLENALKWVKEQEVKG